MAGLGECVGDSPPPTLWSRLSGVFAPLRYLCGVIRRLLRGTTSTPAVEEVRTDDSFLFPERRWCTVRKRLSLLARLLFAVVPSRIQGRLGFPVARDLGQGDISDEIRRSPNKPHGKGSKRKQDDLAEEELCWMESLSDAEVVAEPTCEELK
ncbi:oogenesis-related isoform X2 [Hemitrygon akajei]|uniref:oogenesis-related isoform X2 n=1 Tax=Hemitrygon akajei TaxID=2704970 RepID=UPI003BF96E73